MTTLWQSQTKTSAEGSSTPTPVNLLQRKCGCGQHTIAGGECEGCKKKQAQPALAAALARVPSSSKQAEPNAVPSIVHEVLGSPGQPLDSGTRAFMESRFNHDFSHVRIHTGAKSAESAWSVNALAYTVGRDIVFGSRAYAPETSGGRRLLAHELAHVVQQDGGGASSHISQSSGSGIDSVDSPSEREADKVADAVISMGGASHIALNLENTHDPATQRVSEAVVSHGSSSKRVPLPDSSGFKLSRAWDWRKAACHAACWALGAGITAVVAVACGAGSVVTIGGLAIPCAYAVVATAVAMGAGSSLCSDLCDHALAPPETPVTGGAAGAGGAPPARSEPAPTR